MEKLMKIFAKMLLSLTQRQRALESIILQTFRIETSSLLCERLMDTFKKYGEKAKDFMNQEDKETNLGLPHLHGFNTLMILFKDFLEKLLAGSAASESREHTALNKLNNFIG